jgi:hypothetical protein
MFQFTKEQVDLLTGLNAEVRFRGRGPTYKDNPIPGGPPVIDTSIPGTASCCDVYDKSVPGSEPYVSAWAANKVEAFALAMKQAPLADKPLTPAQKYQASLQASKLSDKDAEIAALKAQLAALNAEPVTVPATPVLQPPEAAEATKSETIKPRATGTQAKTTATQSKGS